MPNRGEKAQPSPASASEKTFHKTALEAMNIALND